MILAEAEQEILFDLTHVRPRNRRLMRELLSGSVPNAAFYEEGNLEVFDRERTARRIGHHLGH